eukprot:Phypoly_transcript_01150.p1 GENE.Phypoly_transcript_01150~~Phypoly_transcript_01150.p1  ORF type:complete len:421 (-),score=55.60 Phypoly_transcript_01150:701-1963(-)
MDIVVSFSRKRKNFGKHCYFSDKPAEIIADIQPDRSLLEEYVEKNPVRVGIQCGPSMSEHWVNTDKFTNRSQAVFHQEGGWPKDIDSTETEPKVRYRKKIEKDEEYVTAVKALSEKVDYYIKLNNAINIYEDYFGDTVDHTSAPPTAKITTILRDPAAGNKKARKAMCSSWHPELHPSRVAVAYSILSHNVEVGASLSSYIWHIETSTQPFLELIPASPLCSIAYNPRDENIILGGARNGLVCFWDVRRGSQAVESSPIERSHKDAVYEVCWINSKTATEFCSASPDGTILWWDTRKLGEPVETIILPLPSAPNATEPPAPIGDVTVEKGMGGVALDLDPSGARFLVGTEQGAVLWCNKKGKAPTGADRIVQTYSGHHGPVYSVKRNPFFSKYFLTVGDWSTKVCKKKKKKEKERKRKRL